MKWRNYIINSNLGILVPLILSKMNLTISVHKHNQMGLYQISCPNLNFEISSFQNNSKYTGELDSAFPLSTIRAYSLEIVVSF